MIVVHSGRNPFAIFLLVACILTGVSGLFSPLRTSPVVAHVLTLLELRIWYGGLLLSGSVALSGLFAHGLASLLFERVGLVVLAAVAAIYAVVVIAQGGAALSPAGALGGCLSVASVARVWQITVDLGKIERRKGEA